MKSAPKIIALLLVIGGIGWCLFQLVTIATAKPGANYGYLVGSFVGGVIGTVIALALALRKR